MGMTLISIIHHSKKESRRKIHKNKIKTSGKGRTHKTKKKILEEAAPTRRTWKKKRNMLAISNTLFSTQDDGAWIVKLASGYKPDCCLLCLVTSTYTLI